MSKLKLFTFLMLVFLVTVLVKLLIAMGRGSVQIEPSAVPLAISTTSLALISLTVYGVILIKRGSFHLFDYMRKQL